MKCRICGKRVRRSFLGIHIFNKHRLNAKAYGVKYLHYSSKPCFCRCGCRQRTSWGGMLRGWKDYVHGHNESRRGQPVPQRVRDQISKKLKCLYKTGKLIPPNRGKSKENCVYFKRMSRQMKGRTVSKSDKKKIAKTLKIKYKNGEISVWNKGKTKFNCPSLMKTSRTNTGNVITKKARIKIAKKVRFLHKHTSIYSNPEYKQKRSVAMKKLAKEGRLWAQSKAGRKKMSELMTERNNMGIMRKALDRRPNNLEKRAANWFKKELVYVGNGKVWVTFKHKHKNPDFVIKKQPKKVIEVFGDYFHKVLKNDYKEITDGYKSIGYQCLVVWEHEIRNNPKKAKHRIRLFLDKVI